MLKINTTVPYSISYRFRNLFSCAVSDILVIAEALNVEVIMPGGVGIQIPNPIANPDDMYARVPSIDDITEDFIQERLGTVIKSVSLIRKKMTEEKIDIPLIGFSAAPYTLLFYMVGGSSRKNKEIGMDWLRNHPEASNHLLNVLTKVIVEYMSAQVSIIIVKINREYKKLDSTLT